VSGRDDEDKVIVKIEIHIALGRSGGTAETAMLSATADARPPGMAPADPGEVEPHKMRSMAPPVRQASATTACLPVINFPNVSTPATVSNVIGGHGTVFVQGNVPGFGSGIRVVAKVFPQGAMIPTNPPMDAQSTMTDGLGNFAFQALGDAVCNNDPYGRYPSNTAKAWVYCNPSQPPSPVSAPFLGQCFHSAEVREFACESLEVVILGETAPAQWRLQVVGFTGDLACFNGSWQLDACGNPAGAPSWDNGGDGGSTPLVRLSCDPGGGAVLLFQLGSFTVIYTRSAACWNALGSNIFAGPNTDGGCTGTAPPSLTIEPI